MARRELTVQRHEEIKRRLADGRSVREIASALSCSRRLVREIRDGLRVTHETPQAADPLWMSQLEWPVIIHDLGLGFPLKFISNILHTGSRTKTSRRIRRPIPCRCKSGWTTTS